VLQLFHGPARPQGQRFWHCCCPAVACELLLPGGQRQLGFHVLFEGDVDGLKQCALLLHLSSLLPCRGQVLLHCSHVLLCLNHLGDEGLNNSLLGPYLLISHTKGYGRFSLDK
jgi:hypothetical protein